MRFGASGMNVAIPNEARVDMPAAVRLSFVTEMKEAIENIVEDIVKKKISELIPFLVIKTEQMAIGRLEPALQKEFDQLCSKLKDENKQREETVFKLKNELIRLKKIVKLQGIKIQDSENLNKKRSVHFAFSLGRVTPELMPRRIDETFLGISKKTIREKHDAAAVVCRQCELLQVELPPEALKALKNAKSYVTNTFIGEEPKWLGRVPGQKCLHIETYETTKMRRIYASEFAVWEQRQKALEKKNIPFPEGDINCLIAQFNDLLLLHSE
jgi:hypothetical protein